MTCVIETRSDGVYVVSNTVNQVLIKAYGDYYIVSGSGKLVKAKNRTEAFGTAFDILNANNVINVDGFIEQLSIYSDIDDNYKATIYNIIAYGIKHECLVHNQFVDWLVSIVANITVYDVIPYMNNYWLNEEYMRIKTHQAFLINQWVLSDEIWPETIGHVDMGNKTNLFRGYRIEVADMVGTRWLPIEIVENESIMEYFNNDEHLEFYKVNNYTPTGRISFMGYFRFVNDEYVPID